MSTPPSSSDADVPVVSEKTTDPESTVVVLSNDSNESSIVEEPGCGDERSPQNWSPWKKRMVFLALMSSSILADG